MQYLRFAYPESPVLFVGCNESSVSSPHGARKSESESASEFPSVATLHEQLLMKYGYFGGGGDRMSRSNTPLPTDLEPDSSKCMCSRF